MRVTAVIATLNEEATVAEVVRNCLRHVDEVLVVDGGSHDGTCRSAQAAGARAMALGQRGKGLALRQGIAAANGEVLLFIDADGSHRPQDIPLLLAPILRDEADLVIASRVAGGSDELRGAPGHLLRALGTRALQTLVNRRFRVRLTDIQNGFRAIRTAVAHDLGLRESGFCIEQEMVIACLRRGYRVVNVPSREHRRRHGRSRLSLWRDAPRFVWSAAWLLWAGDVPSDGGSG